VALKKRDFVREAGEQRGECCGLLALCIARGGAPVDALAMVSVWIAASTKARTSKKVPLAATRRCADELAEVVDNDDGAALDVRAAVAKHAGAGARKASAVAVTILTT
jgi:hypothetical protein